MRSLPGARKASGIFASGEEIISVYLLASRRSGIRIASCQGLAAVVYLQYITYLHTVIRGSRL